MIDFEWDPAKDQSNREKHGVTFSEARTVFDDPLARTILDPRDFEAEDRYATTGYTSGGRLLVIWHTERDDRIRIIGAREATTHERRSYEAEAW